MFVRAILFLVALVVLASCYETPPECAALCKRVEQWAVHCKKPVLTTGTCEKFYRTEVQSTLAMHCWQLQIDWTPDLSAEFDCGKPPPALRR